MAKFCGKIGYHVPMGTKNGVPIYDKTERIHYGDVLKSNIKTQSSNKVNDDINVLNVVSIVATNFANKNFKFMKYLELYGVKWKVTNVEVDYPRLIINIGGPYNG